MICHFIPDFRMQQFSDGCIKTGFSENDQPQSLGFRHDGRRRAGILGGQYVGAKATPRADKLRVTQFLSDG